MHEKTFDEGLLHDLGVGGHLPFRGDLARVAHDAAEDRAPDEQHGEILVVELRDGLTGLGAKEQPGEELAPEIRALPQERLAVGAASRVVFGLDRRAIDADIAAEKLRLVRPALLSTVLCHVRPPLS